MCGAMNYSEYYNKSLADGQEYQDFVAEQLYKIGLPLFNYASKKYQFKYGENKLGVEIKYDKIHKATGRVWIEVSEKSNPRNKEYVKSGIYRNDNTWLYVIGDYSVIYIFSKKLLRQLAESSKYKIRENSTKTSEGFLLPLADVIKYTAKIINIPQLKKVDTP